MRLKLLKRFIYGRANLNLLRQRLLLATRLTKLGEELIYWGWINFSDRCMSHLGAPTYLLGDNLQVPRRKGNFCVLKL